MHSFGVWVPTRLHFGPGEFAKAGELARQFGRKALVVTYPATGPLQPQVQKLLSLLQQAGVETVLFDRVEPNPLTTTADAGAAAARREGCDLVVALGGGSAIDCGKCIALAAVNHGSIWDYMPSGSGTPLAPQAALPIVAITTTAGTGSEMNQNAVLTNPATKEKPGMGHPLLHPRVAIVDPQLMVSLPPRVTASTGIDVLFHALEGYIALQAQPFTDLLCVEAIRLVVANLKEAVANGGNLEARAAMAWANSLAGIVIDLSGVVLLHAAGHPISAYHDAPHGETLVALARPFIRLTQAAKPVKFAKLTELLGGRTAGLTLEEAAAASEEALSRFLDEVGLRVTLRELNAQPALIPEYARVAFKTMQGCIAGQPTPVTEEIIAGLYHSAFSLA
jgi:alcohol dehydrogenase